MSWAEEAFGPELVGADGARAPTAEALAGRRRVAVYVSASWCGPCARFTPLLSVLYEDQEEGEAKAHVVFVSRDKDAAQFAGYLADMPWSAVPFEDTARREALVARFGGGAIPHLAILDAATGETLAADARALVTAARSLSVAVGGSAGAGAAGPA